MSNKEKEQKLSRCNRARIKELHSRKSLKPTERERRKRRKGRDEKRIECDAENDEQEQISGHFQPILMNVCVFWKQIRNANRPD